MGDGEGAWLALGQRVAGEGQVRRGGRSRSSSVSLLWCAHRLRSWPLGSEGSCGAGLQPNKDSAAHGDGGRGSGRHGWDGGIGCGGLFCETAALDCPRRGTACQPPRQPDTPVRSVDALCGPCATCHVASPGVHHVCEHVGCVSGPAGGMAGPGVAVAVVCMTEDKRWLSGRRTLVHNTTCTVSPVGHTIRVQSW